MFDKVVDTVKDSVISRTGLIRPKEIQRPRPPSPSPLDRLAHELEAARSSLLEAQARAEAAEARLADADARLASASSASSSASTKAEAEIARLTRTVSDLRVQLTNARRQRISPGELAESNRILARQVHKLACENAVLKAGGPNLAFEPAQLPAQSASEEPEASKSAEVLRRRVEYLECENVKLRARWGWVTRDAVLLKRQLDGGEYDPHTWFKEQASAGTATPDSIPTPDSESIPITGQRQGRRVRFDESADTVLQHGSPLPYRRLDS